MIGNNVYFIEPETKEEALAVNKLLLKMREQKSKEWKDKVLQGMMLIKEGCKENATGVECYKCPFNDICTTLECKSFITLPSDWFEQED